MHIHILGICGTFMGSLALLAREAGHQVTGADQNVYPPMSLQLESAGIELQQGYQADYLASISPDVVIIGNAMSRGNPSVEYVLNEGLRYQSGPEWLAEHVLRDRWVLAVAGTHGKTSTASMLAWILSACGHDTGFLIGGVPANFGQSARLGSARPAEPAYFVIEADEYDTAFFDKRSKFVHYHPRTLVLNNLEFDHADIFDDLAAIQKQFHHLVRTVAGNGRILLPEDAALQEVIEQGCWSELEYLGGEQSLWQLEQHSNDQSAFTVRLRSGEVHTEGRVEWALCGKHNQANALSAIAAAAHIGIDVADAARALGEFKSVKRRLELIGDINGVYVYDDFAHHPSAIKTTLAGLRARYPDNRIIAIIEPRSNTMRMGNHLPLLPDAIREADDVFWFEAAADQQGQTPLQQLFAGSDNACVYQDINQIVAAVSAQVAAGDQVVIMSNGGFGGIHGQLLASLEDMQNAG